MVNLFSTDKIKDILKERLSKKRYIHSINVADQALCLARKWDLPEDRAYLAGLLHDICKDTPQIEQYKMITAFEGDVSIIEKGSPPLWHAIAGAYYSKKVIGIEDEDILSAIRFHTIAAPNMSHLSEIIYLADLVSIDRTYKDVERMRKLAFADIKKAMYEALIFSIKDVIAKGQKLPISTIEAYNYYTKK